MMDKQSSSASDLSLDSLENEYKKKSHRKRTPSEENVDTILVPFYENDVLIKVPKDHKKKQKQESNSKSKKEFQPSNSYLIKKETKKTKRTTYLEMFRKQFTPAKVEKKQDDKEICSISPEYGDTERESFGEEDNNNNPETEFYNTESYNEIFYDKILNSEMEYLENSFVEGLQLEEKTVRSESPDGSADSNLKSVSEVTQPRRHKRRATVQPVQTVKLGGLGPDMEKIKPRLERARSLQRYSEKVRMENRLKIYKKSVQADIEMKAEREPSARCRDSSKEENSASYLVNKSFEEKTIKKFHLKAKSAGAQRIRERNKEKELLKDERTKKNAEERQNDKHQDSKTTKKGFKNSSTDERKSHGEVDSKIQSVKSSARNRGINTDKEITLIKEIPPVQISFMVNVGGMRPSSALKTLEEKHRMYQEQVKAYTMNSNNI